MAKQRSSKKSTSGSIRIIAGMHRGRKLPVLDAQGLRPTTDRVKETVFNWLMPYCRESDCLDCFAGAGSLGFEALSRGANSVVMCELDKSAAQQLTRNAKLLNAENVQVIQGDALTYLRQPPQAKDIIFIDPPFRQGLAEKAINEVDKGWLKPNGLVYLEVESELQLSNLPSSWCLLKEKVAGQVAYRLYQKTT
ncbi:16S rRNA (guanine(966)-N(2))-methyltransferase RsmD [Thalassotalea sp. LPB0316]|uniref:16S rRNA (guanine(966)-N(2))-methyltransferase RsmD n=1 Tax=Thalassotalea sp. LPB0316 TaxID=2769490 RepID=UPI00186608FA|nr:16S rRNA (guanine(966)-N(2))-methyltransferase RsmD [Thalassotalea sp. LPB0316]QOL26330.1 16S rRNA (guanine(966)-N(2))-methyltransferase RsmD [Thalassotalea sp. LPB0316]